MNEDQFLMEETISSAHEYLGNAMNAIEGMVSLLRSGREEKAIPMCVDLIEGMQWLVECFSLTKPVLQSKAIYISLENANQINSEIVEAFENKDYVLLADLLEYELIPVLQKWESDIAQVVGIDKMN